MLYEIMPTQDLNGWPRPWGPGGYHNIFDNDNASWVTGKYLDASGNLANNANYRYTDEYTPCDASSDYVFSYVKTSARYIGSTVCFYNASKGFIERQAISASVSVAGRIHNTITTPANAAFLRMSMPIESDEQQIDPGDVLHDWCPYSNICYPQGFELYDEEGNIYTVYAGFVDSSSGELLLRPVYQSYAGETLTGPWMSSEDEYSEEGTPTAGAFVIDLGGALTTFQLTPYMLKTLLEAMGISTGRTVTEGSGLLNLLMDQAQGRVRSEEELLNRSVPLRVLELEELPTGLKIRAAKKKDLPGLLPGKYLK